MAVVRHANIIINAGLADVLNSTIIVFLQINVIRLAPSADWRQMNSCLVLVWHLRKPVFLPI